jgi:hypothetical protein
MISLNGCAEVSRRVLAGGSPGVRRMAGIQDSGKNRYQERYFKSL